MRTARASSGVKTVIVLRSSSPSREKTMPNQKRSIKIGRMKFWFARGTEITLREQLVTQTILGILCGDLVPGQRLPSTREIARSFRLHPNTVSAGYRQLERENWLELRHGSGVYVRDTRSVLSIS